MDTFFRGDFCGRILWMLVTPALPFLLLAAFVLAELKASQQDLASDRLVQAAQSTANAVTQRLATSVGYLTALSTSEAAQADDLPALYAQAQLLMRTLPEASAISLVAQDKAIVFMTLRPLGTRGLVSHDAESVQLVFKTGRPVVSGPFKAPISEKLLTAVSVPVLRNGKVVYCLRMILFPSSLSELLIAQKLPEDWTLAIVAANGKLVARSHAAERFVGELARAEVRAAIAAKTATLLNATAPDGDAVKVAIAQLPGWDWSVVVAVPERYWRDSQRRNLGLLALFGLALAALGTLVTVGLRRLSVLPSQKGGSAGPTAGPAGHSRRSAWPAAIPLAVAVALTVLAAMATQASLAQLLQRADQRLAAGFQRAQITELLSQFKDLETGQRGFVITGREVFLQPYNSAVEAIPSLLAELKADLSQSDIEGFNWAELEALAKERQALSAQAVAERREQGDGVLKDGSLFDRGRLVMDKLRLKLSALEALLSQRVDVLTEQLQREGHQATQLQWLSTLAAGTLLAFSVGLWVRERGRRKRLYEKLEASHQQLEAHVTARTAELQAASTRIRNFSIESERSIEAERKRLSREVHDQIGQIFTGIKMILSGLRPGSLAQEQQVALASALDMGVKTARRIAAELRPPLLDDLGLRAALDLYLRTVLEPAGLSFELELPPEHGLSNERSTQLFRVVQEAVSNVIRHAQASHVSVTLVATPAAWALQIDDDGAGFDPSTVRASALGLLGIQERAQMLGGKAVISGLPSGGTRVAVELPRGASA